MLIYDNNQQDLM